MHDILISCASSWPLSCLHREEHLEEGYDKLENENRRLKRRIKDLACQNSAIEGLSHQESDLRDVIEVCVQQIYLIIA